MDVFIEVWTTSVLEPLFYSSDLLYQFVVMCGVLVTNFTETDKEVS